MRSYIPRKPCHRIVVVIGLLAPAVAAPNGEAQNPVFWQSHANGKTLPFNGGTAPRQGYTRNFYTKTRNGRQSKNWGFPKNFGRINQGQPTSSTSPSSGYGNAPRPQPWQMGTGYGSDRLQQPTSGGIMPGAPMAPYVAPSLQRRTAGANRNVPTSQGGRWVNRYTGAETPGPAPSTGNVQWKGKSQDPRPAALDAWHQALLQANQARTRQVEQSVRSGSGNAGGLPTIPLPAPPSDGTSGYIENSMRAR